MKIEDSPLSFFENLLEYDKYEEMKKEYMDRYLEEWGNLNFKNKVIDYEKGIIKEDKYTDLSFGTYFINLINSECSNAKQNIDKSLLAIVSKNVSPNEFLKFLLKILNSLILKSDKYYFEHHYIKQAITTLIKHINNKFETDSTYKQNQIHSFKEGNEDIAIETIESLYNQLISIKIIEGSKEDFINAFMGKSLQNGIKWLPKTKDNKNTSKPSLFAFIDYLMEENFIKDIEDKDYNDAIKYVFRDYKGNLFKNIRQSKSSSTAIIPESIKEIVDNLK